jgi:hypothetical protein
MGSETDHCISTDFLVMGVQFGDLEGSAVRLGL